MVTNDAQAAAVRRQLPRVPAAHILSEPVGRNTAAAIGLAAIHIARRDPDALMAVLPADHFIARAKRYRGIVSAALEVAARGENLVVLGIVPTRPDTGFGYIERTGPASRVRGAAVFRVKRFTEKPSLARAQQYVASGRYLWNAGMFFWRASTFLNHLKRLLPATHAALERLADTVGTRSYATTLRRVYPQLKNISVDYAVMEPATRARGAKSVHVLPADIGWSDIGSWAAVYELLAARRGDNLATGRSVFLDAAGNFVWCPGKFVAGIGIRDLIVVETPDALLLCPRDRAQDVGRIVKWLEARRLRKLL
jgi:mannose-1-phosphate guanylyltransferase